MTDELGKGVSEERGMGPRTLLVDTAGQDGVMALAEGDRVVREERLPGRTASEGLIPAIRRMLAAMGWSIGGLSAIGVVRGPGSFTGVRVGLSAAKGLSEAASIPLIAISRLELVASMAGDMGEMPVWAFLSAGRGEVYAGEYVRGRSEGEALLSTAEAVRAVQRSVGATAVVCEPMVADLLREVGPRMLPGPGIGDLLPLVLRRLRAGDLDDAAALDANYLRRTDLEMLATMEARRAGR